MVLLYIPICLISFLGRLYFLLDLCKLLSRHPVIGFMRFWTCWDALNLGYKHEKRVFDLGHWLVRYCASKFSIYFLRMMWDLLCTNHVILWSSNFFDGRVWTSLSRLGKIIFKWLGGAVKLDDLIGQNWLEWLFFTRTLEDNISGFCDWIYAILDLLGSPWSGLYARKKSIWFGSLAGEILHFKV